jgi:hypothetical protein
MTAQTFESDISRRYAALGLPTPVVRWAPNPERFDAMLAAARVEAVLASGIGVDVMRDVGCLCPVCLGLDITMQITPFLPTMGDRRRFALIDAVADTESGVQALSVGSHVRNGDAESTQRSVSRNDGLLWATVWEDADDVDPVTTGADAWACTPHVFVALEPGIWSIDEDGWLHDADGTPAMLWQDGWSASFEHGVHIPRWATDAEALTVERINRTDNVELRRILAGRLGYDWFLANDRFSRIIDDDAQRGQLWDLSRDWRGDQSRLLRVLDATPTPVGDRKVYWLNVPPSARTAQEAAAWTFGLEPDEYAPEVET